MADSLTWQHRAIWKRMRPPSARPLQVLHGFSMTSPDRSGWVLRLAEGEPAVAPGDGEVAAIRVIQPFWLTALVGDGQPSFQVVLHHGFGSLTLLAGLTSVAVAVRQRVQRGDPLGNPFQREVFFQAVDKKRLVNPAHINRHFDPSSLNPSPAAGWLDQAPDRLRRTFDSVESVLLASIRQFNYPPCVDIDEFVLQSDGNYVLMSDGSRIVLST